MRLSAISELLAWPTETGAARKVAHYLFWRSGALALASRVKILIFITYLQETIFTSIFVAMTIYLHISRHASKMSEAPLFSCAKRRSSCAAMFPTEFNFGPEITLAGRPPVSVCRREGARKAERGFSSSSPIFAQCWRGAINWCFLFDAITASSRDIMR